MRRSFNIRGTPEGSRAAQEVLSQGEEGVCRGQQGMSRHKQVCNGNKPKPLSFSSAVFVARQENEASRPDARNDTPVEPVQKHRLETAAKATTGKKDKTSRSFVNAARVPLKKRKHVGGASVSSTKSTSGEEKGRRWRSSSEGVPAEMGCTVTVPLSTGRSLRRWRGRRWTSRCHGVQW